MKVFLIALLLSACGSSAKDETVCTAAIQQRKTCSPNKPLLMNECMADEKSRSAYDKCSTITDCNKYTACLLHEVVGK